MVFNCVVCPARKLGRDFFPFATETLMCCEKSGLFLHFVVLFDELIQFENIFLAIADNFDCLFFLIFLLAVGFSCLIFMGRSMMEHSFDHGSVG